jgi:predicted acylesterase/phospholipase RssA
MYENLVFQGGGTKGFAFIGVIRALDEYNILPFIKRYAGSSIGSLAATLLAVGYSYNEIKDELLSLNLSIFREVGNECGCLTIFFNIFKDYGLYKNNKIYDFIGKLIAKKTNTNNKDYSFKNLYDDKGIELVITGTSLTKSKTHYFHYLTFPDMSIRKAVQISTALPFIYKPVKFNGEMMIDGGILNNYPIYIFDHGNILKNIPVKDYDYNTKTLGFVFSNDILDQKDNDVVGIRDYYEDIVKLILTEIERLKISDGYWERTVKIQTGLIGTDFKISDIEKKQLIESGYIATIDYLTKNTITI